MEGWLRGVDLNHRPLGYEPNELPDCSTPHFDDNRPQPLLSARTAFDGEATSHHYLGILMVIFRVYSSAKSKSWSKRYRPWPLAFSEQHPDYRSARKRENELKAQKGGRGFFVKTGLDPKRFGR